MSIETLLEMYPSLEIDPSNPIDPYDNPSLWLDEMLLDIYDPSDDHAPIDDSLDELLTNR